MKSSVQRLRKSINYSYNHNKSLFFKKSKSLISLNDISNGTYATNVNGVQLCTTANNPTTIHDPNNSWKSIQKFAAPTTFPQLRQLVEANNNFLREIISIFDERAQLDFAYSKSMQKLSTKLHKLSQAIDGLVDQGWSCIAEQFAAQSTIHSNFGSAITDDIVQPLRTIFSSQYQTIRATSQLVDREMKRVNDKLNEAMKTKRHLYSWCHELERIEQIYDENRYTNAKLSTKKRKLLEQVVKGEQIYVDEMIEAEKQRRILDGILSKGVERFETIEKQRLAHCQTAFGRFQRKIAQLGPSLNTLFEHYIDSLNASIAVDSVAHVDNLTPSCSAHHISYLCDFHAENLGEAIVNCRRKCSLERISMLLHEQRQHQYIEEHETTNSLSFTLNDFMEYTIFKVDGALQRLGSCQKSGYSQLKRYELKSSDKTGLPQTILRIPISFSVRQSQQYHLSCNTNACISKENAYDEIIQNGSSTESSYQPLSSSDLEASSIQEKQICRVLYDFTSELDEELDIQAGDCVIVERRLGDDWLIGRKVQNLNMRPSISKTGRFPTSYVAL